MMHKKAIRFSGIILLFAIQVLFLLAIFKENTQSYAIGIFISSICLFLIYAYLKSDLHFEGLNFEPLKIILWVPIGAICTYYLNHKYQLGPVLSASIIGVVTCLLPYLNKKSEYLKTLAPAAYCGAFVGMSSTTVAPSLTFILAASFFTAILLMVSKNLMIGVGGKLGTLAFLGVCITYLLLYLLA